jgi:hypothetical protein
LNNVYVQPEFKHTNKLLYSYAKAVIFIMLDRYIKAFLKSLYLMISINVKRRASFEY